jgi:hypothetical protein
MNTTTYGMTTTQPILNDITQSYPNISSEEIVSLLNSGVDLMKNYSDKNYMSEKGMNFDSQMRGPSTNIYQNNFSGTSNVYSPYLYYIKNSNDNKIPKEINSVLGNTTMIPTTIGGLPTTTRAPTTTREPTTTRAPTTATIQSLPTTTRSSTTTPHRTYKWINLGNNGIEYTDDITEYTSISTLSVTNTFPAFDNTYQMGLTKTINNLTFANDINMMVVDDVTHLYYVTEI